MNTMLKTAVSTAQALAIVAGTAGLFAMAPVSGADAAQITKPMVNGYSMYYNAKPKAKDSARYRWGLAAAEKYGAGFAHWGKAKQKSIKCNWTAVPGMPGKEAWRCRASAKPVKNVMICESPIKASGKIYKAKAKAKDSAVYRWGLKVAANEGANMAHWGKARQKNISCSTGVKGNWTCVARAKPCK
jgi:hypothetical protein